jgi:rhamnose transport system ATP-binding protein
MSSTPHTEAQETAAPATFALRGVTKSFGPVVALANGTIVLEAGRIHALVGENGAGKSTMVKTIAGIYQPDTGSLELRGETVTFRDAGESKAAGISVIYQEPTLFPDLTVAENIFIGRQPKNRFGFVDRAAMRDMAAALFRRLGVPIDPERSAEGLSIADQQIIEIAKAISLDARVLVMDEPTAALSGVEVDRLFAVARSLRDQGAAILFISHRFDEVFALCDTITVMRDGAYIATHDAKEITVDALVREMVGRDISTLFPKSEAEIGDVVLRVEGLTRAGVFHDIDFEVRAGEIVGLAGLVGAGRTEVARAVAPRSPKASIEAGMAFVPEDRRKQGLVMDLSVTKNTTLTLRHQLSRFGLISRARELAAAEDWSRRLQVKTGAQDLPVSTLSGGNQQKVVLAKWLATDPRFLIVDEPTRGIDIGTKAEVHRLLSELAGRGIAVLMISSELPEVLGMADRILVMHEGRISAVLARADATAEKILHAATTDAEVAA